MRQFFYTAIYHRFLVAGLFLVLVIAAGTAGFWFIGKGAYSVIDCLYMTVITISTIGYGEIIDMSASPGGRIFTMVLALTGIGTLSYIITNFTASIVEGDLSESFRRRRMDALSEKLNAHYIVCGFGRIGRQIVNELIATKRSFAIVEARKDATADLPEELKNAVIIDGDATNNDVLLRAGIKRARGVFCVVDDDNVNLVISLTAKQLNPAARVVTRCGDMQKKDKLTSIGSDAVVSPTFIGGLRMVSEMVRPTVVSFLDIMLRDKDRNLRIEEVSVSDRYIGKELKSLGLHTFPETLLLAIKSKESWIYNPQESHRVAAGDGLVIMTTPDERTRLEQHLR